MKNLKFKLASILGIALLMSSCSNDDDSGSTTSKTELEVTKSNLDLVLSNKRAYTIEVTSPVALDYNQDGASSTDIFSQMILCEVDDYFLFSDQDYIYYFESKCDESQPNYINDGYVIDGGNIWLLSFSNDGSTTQDFILENPKLYYTGDSEYGNALYQFEYDLLDSKTGEKFHWVRQTREN